MRASQYNKRFITKIKKAYLLILPFFLILTILFNNYLIDFYYRVPYREQYKSIVKEIETYIQKHGQLPVRSDVHYRKIPNNTAPYSYFEYHFKEIEDINNRSNTLYRVFFEGAVNNSKLKTYRTTIRFRGALYEIEVFKIDVNIPGGPDKEVALFGVAFSLILFLLLNWGFFQFNIRRISFNLWKPFYQNLRRINAYHIKNQKPLELVTSSIREFEFFNQAILDFTDKTQKAYNQLREFTENTAHELQTPLSILLAKVELILKNHTLEPNTNRELLEIKKTIVRLSSIHKGLNLLSRIRSMQYGGSIEKKTLLGNSIILESLETYEELLEYKEINVKISDEHNWCLATNEELFRILIDNLIRNAIQHNLTGGQINLTMLEQGIEICNTGTRPEDSTQDLFQRYRTNSKDNGRLGLGLAIVEAICDTLGFTCTYQYQKEQHCFSISYTKSGSFSEIFTKTAPLHVLNP
ncbi:MAG: HAMP domain-containing sensor histidine kinase [Siphonobacter sp.]